MGRRRIGVWLGHGWEGVQCVGQYYNTQVEGAGRARGDVLLHHRDPTGYVLSLAAAVPLELCGLGVMLTGEAPVQGRVQQWVGAGVWLFLLLLYVVRFRRGPCCMLMWLWAGGGNDPFPWQAGTLAPCHPGNWPPWHVGTLPPWHLGTLPPCHLGHACLCNTCLN